MKVFTSLHVCILLFNITGFSQTASLQNAGNEPPHEFVFGDENNVTCRELKHNTQKWLTEQATLGFEENNGQMADVKGNPLPDVLYRASVPGLHIYVTTHGLTWQFFKLEEDEKYEKKSRYVKRDNNGEEKQKGEWHSVNMLLKDAVIKKDNVLAEREETKSSMNYYFSHCPQGIHNVKTYSRITIQNIYPGIDWVIYTFSGKGLKHDFIIHPHSDPGLVRLVYEGSGTLHVNKNRISFGNACGELREGELLCYQGNPANAVLSHYRVKVTSKKIRKGFSCEVGIETGVYNPQQDLIIDPQLEWGTYYGGFAYDGVRAAVTDAIGNVFVAGYANSSNFLPALNPGGGAYYQGANIGGYDIFLLKFNTNGVLQWATQYGGTGDEAGLSLATDGSGNIYMTGYTTSGNLPTLDPGGGAYYLGTNASAGAYGVFLLKFANNGTRLWASYFGNGIGTGSDLTIDNSGNLFVTGYSESSGMPVANPGGGAYFQGGNAGGSDVFVLKFSITNALLWSTYYGGTAYDLGYSIGNDASGNIFVTGYTSSTNLSTFNAGGSSYFQGSKSGFFDAFLLKFSNSGACLWATYYGGSGDEFGNDLTVDGSGNLFVTGATSSNNFPTQNAGTYFDNSLSGQHDIFIIKFSNSCSRQWSTYYGGSGVDAGVGDETGYSIITDISGNVYVTGYTSSTNFPTLNPGGGAYFKGSNSGGPIDSYFLGFSNTGTRLWATYNGTNYIDFGTALATDPSGSLISAGEWESSGSNGLFNPGGGAYFIGSFSGSDDSYIMKFRNPVPLPVELISFEAKCRDEKSVIVQWETASEINNDYFSVLRSSDGINFEISGIVNGMGNSNVPLSYSFIDKESLNEINYYRLEQTDYNGKNSLSEIVILYHSCNKINDISIVPNPVRDFVTVNMTDKKLNYEIEIYNALGGLVVRNRNTEKTDVSFLSPAIYTLKLKEDNKSRFFKFVKQ